MPTSRFDAFDVTPPRLGRTLQPRHIALITLGGVIGAGLFVGSSASIHAAGPAIVLSYLIAGAIVYGVMAMIAALAAHYGDIQAFTDLVRASSGPGLGFVIGWLYWYLWVIVIAIEALAGGAILQTWIAAPTWLISALLVLSMMAINLLPTRSFGEFEFWFSSVKVLAILGFVFFGAVACLLTPTARNVSWNHFFGQPGGFIPHGWASVMTGVVTVFFSLTGAELTTVAAAEARASARRQTNMTLVLIGRIVLFYVISVFLILCLVPWTSVVPGTSPFATALYAHGAPWAGTAMTVVILTAVLSCLNSAFFISSRVLFGLAVHDDAPKRLVRLSSRAVPRNSVLLGGFCSAACLIAATIAPGTAFAFLVNASGALILFIYLGVCVAYLRHARNDHAHLRAGPQVMAGITAAAMLALLVAMARDAALANQLYASAVPLLLTVAIWGVRRRSRGKPVDIQATCRESS